MARAGDSKIVVELRVKVEELRRLHNRLTDLVILLKFDVENIKKFVKYVPPTQSELTDTQRQQALQDMRAGGAGGAAQGAKKPVRRIDN